MVLEKVWNEICRNKLFDIGDAVVLAVSGGTDSMVMLHILNSVRSRLDLTLHVAHLNHMLRGSESEEDAAFVQNAAELMGLQCTVGRVNVPAQIAKQKLSPEDAARTARYKFLFQTAQEIGAERIAVAHHADDQAETLVLHLLNGTGVEGLQGMKPIHGKVVRPLLRIRRKEIEEYCFHHGISFRADLTNNDVTIPRNRIRHHLMPILREYNPNVVEALNRTAEIIRAENDYIERETIFAYQNLVNTAPGDEISIGAENFSEAETALQRRVIRKVFMKIVGEDESLGFGHVERVRDFIVSGQTGKRIELPGNVIVEKGYSAALFKLAADASDFAENNELTACPLNIPGITMLPAVNAKVNADVLPLAAVKDKVYTAPPEVAYLDLDQLIFPLIVGPKKEGESFSPLGSRGSKKIKKFLIDEKIPRKERQLVPVLYDAKGIVWVMGFAIDERVKVTESTNKVLRLQIWAKPEIEG